MGGVRVWDAAIRCHCNGIFSVQDEVRKGLTNRKQKSIFIFTSWKAVQISARNSDYQTCIEILRRAEEDDMVIGSWRIQDGEYVSEMECDIDEIHDILSSDDREYAHGTGVILITERGAIRMIVKKNDMREFAKIVKNAKLDNRFLGEAINERGLYVQREVWPQKASEEPTVFLSVAKSEEPTVFLSVAKSEEPTVFLSVAKCEEPTVFLSVAKSEEPTVFISMPVEEELEETTALLPLSSIDSSAALFSQSDISEKKVNNDELAMAHVIEFRMIEVFCIVKMDKETVDVVFMIKTLARSSVNKVVVSRGVTNWKELITSKWRVRKKENVCREKCVHGGEDW